MQNSLQLSQIKSEMENIKDEIYTYKKKNQID